MTALWHPFADMAEVAAAGELVLRSGDGQYVVDEEGRRYLDVTAGLWFANVGHGRREIADAVGRQAATLAAHSVFGDLANRPALDLAERVASLAPVADSKVFFTSGGSDSVDTAAKLVRRFWQVKGEVQRTAIITRDRAYHGMHWGGTALSGIGPNKDGYGEVVDDVAHVAWDDAGALADTIDALGSDRVAAFFCEPVIGAGGVYAAGEEYLRAAREVCRERGVLWVSDEVITGFGRLGDWFASGRYDLHPDVLLTAKGLTSGYVPMGAVVVAPSVAEPFWSHRGNAWRHGYTYSGHAVAAAAALANLDILERERLVERVLELEPVLVDALAPLADLPAVSEVRAGAGLLAAIQIDPERLADDPGLVQRVVLGMRARGVLTRGLVDGSLQVSPPFVIQEGDLKTLVAAVEEALADAGTA
ncbi:MAG: aminotransferase class III-fold pyridoxal phosphate-dependent enzyme [Actinomycetota bacterium]|nr:aminotransferase class III-fold pyridoxal phosphate-dependent enzyme [Actinomycetota bacterium]